MSKKPWILGVALLAGILGIGLGSGAFAVTTGEQPVCLRCEAIKNGTLQEYLAKSSMGDLAGAKAAALRTNDQGTSNAVSANGETTPPPKK